MTGTQYFNMGANKMGMIANMILNFPVDPMRSEEHTVDSSHDSASRMPSSA